MIKSTFKKNLLPVLIIISMIFGCKSKKMDKQENPIITTGKKIKKEILSPNKTKKLVLTFNQDINPRIMYNYAVVEVKTNTTVKEGNFTGTKLEWQNDTSLIGYLYQGVEVKDANIKTSKKFVIIKLEK